MKRGLCWTLVGLAIPALAAAQIVKPPDSGPYWNPLDPTGGTYVYSDSFVAPAQPASTIALGTWLQICCTDTGDQPSRSTLPAGQAPAGVPATPNSVRFEIWGVTGGGGPDAANVIASTGSVTPAVTSTLAYFEYPLPAPVALTPGQEYFFVATVVGETGDTRWQVGAHTQNSVYADNGTFWYSNDPAGVNFDGQNLTPEMAFAVIVYQAPTIQAIPTLGGAGLVLLVATLALAATWLLRRSRASRA